LNSVVYDLYNSVAREMFDLRKCDITPNLLQFHVNRGISQYVYCAPLVKAVLKYNKELVVRFNIPVIV